MEAKLETLFKALETQRLELLKEVRNLSTDQLNQHQNQKWSINQILGHLITAEQLSIGYINKKINAINEVDNTGLWNEIKLLIFIVSQRLPLKYKAPKTIGDRPKSFSSPQIVEQEWNATRQELKTLLERFSSSQLNKEIYKHPVMGRSNIVQALISIREHIIHHTPQIKKLLRG
jgi:uncharacterized damage-inducible protein DinB